jgi:hypothetical protein
MSDEGRSFVLSELGQESYLMVRPSLCKALGGDCTTAIILTKLVSMYQYFSGRNELEDGEFFVKVSDIEDQFGINAYGQRKSLGILESLGCLTQAKKGEAQLRWVLLNFNKISPLLRSASKGSVKKEKVAQTKEEFYQKLNQAETVKDFAVAKDNIPSYLGEGLLAFSSLYKAKKGESFVWNPKSYGIFRRFFTVKTTFGQKPFDYEIVEKYLNVSKEPNLLDFKQFTMASLESSRPKSLSDIAPKLGLKYF